MPILNYSTKIDSNKTLSEIQRILQNAGAKKMIIDNDGTNPISLTFCIQWNGFMTAFCLPCNFEGVLKAMEKNKKVPRSMCNREQAVRVGWRILKDWVSAQGAIVEAEVATLAEVFLPYAVTKDGDTLYKHIDKSDNNRKLLLNN